jgi:hypothetical protein
VKNHDFTPKNHIFSLFLFVMSAGAEPGEPHPKSEKKKIFLGVKS